MATKIAEVKRQMDAAIADVMPESWEGHARLHIREEEDLSATQEEFALRLTSRLMDKDKEYDAESVAVKAIEKAKEKV